jgi:hypothetical protein
MQRRTILILAAGVAAGCAAGRTPPPAGSPKVAIRAAGSEHTSLAADSRSERVGHGAGTGGSRGLGAGAASGLACGTWAPLCVPVFGLVGLVVGGVGGMFYGLSGLPAEKAVKINAMLTALDARRDLRAELAAALARDVPADLQAGPDAATLDASTRIERFKLKQRGGHLVSLHLRASMTIAWDKAAGNWRESRRFEYESESPTQDIDAWIAGGEAGFDAAVSDCLEDVVRQMRGRLIGGFLVA